MAGKQTPRQKMINMMYLVLIALLALNVSRDVIDAFRLVNESVLETNTNLEQKLEDTYANFERYYEFNRAKAEPYWLKALEAKNLTGEMISYIKRVKSEVIAKTERVPVDSARNISIDELSSKDNYTTPTNYFIGDQFDKGNSKATELKNKIDEYRQNMRALIDPKYYDQVNLGLYTGGPYYNADGQEESWEMHFFYHTILVADITLLNKLINDVLNAEFDVVNLLHKSIGQGDFKFDRISARVLPQSKMVFTGDEFEAQLLVAAFDTSQSPEVYYAFADDSITLSRMLANNKLQSDDMVLKFPATSEGRKFYKGFVRVKTAIETVNDYPFSGDYYVSAPSYSVSAKKMNVFYVGVDNPVSIAVSGVSRDKIRPSISCGTIKPDPGSKDWLVNVGPDCNNVMISVSTYINGLKKDMGAQFFRVKKLPDPVATVANKRSGIIKRDLLIAAGGVKVKMPDDFEFDHSFSISSFTMTIQRGLNEYNYESKGAELTDEMKKQLKRTNRGQQVIFQNIMAMSPGDEERELPAIVLTID